MTTSPPRFIVGGGYYDEDCDGLVAIAKDQLKENSHLIDVNVDYVGRDGIADMNEI